MKHLLFITLLCSATSTWAASQQQPDIEAGASQDEPTQQMGGPETPEVHSPGAYGEDPNAIPIDSEEEEEEDNGDDDGHPDPTADF